MEIKVNDYVKTKQGLIGKLKYTGLADFDSTPYYIETRKRKNWINKCNIIKSSPNIIDLIEVGDYVNGMRVSELLKRGRKTKYIRFMADSDYEFSTELKEEEIETILTKEMFEQMEYKVGSEVN